jgi:hypothetical protein
VTRLWKTGKSQEIFWSQKSQGKVRKFQNQGKVREIIVRKMVKTGPQKLIEIGQELVENCLKWIKIGPNWLQISHEWSKIDQKNDKT